jgi:NADH-ubiquinone oxidoreductase chain 2
MLNQTPFLYSIYFTLIIRTIITALRPNWIIAWIILELNILRFIPIIIKSKTNQETEASIKYFLSQAIGSIIILLRIRIINQIIIQELSKLILILSIILKLGVVPCHFWYPSVIMSISWINCLILSTWQKLAPLTLLISISYISKSITILILIAAINALIGGIIGINQTHLRSLLAYSSIGHMGWIISILRINKITSCISYFILYTIIVIPVFIILNSVNTKSIKRLYRSFKRRFIKTIILITSIISLAGIPPLTGFLPKIIVVMNIIRSKFYITLIILIVGSYINLYYYLNITLNIIIISSISINQRKRNRIIAPTFIIASSILGIFPLIIYALTTINKS